MSDVVHAAHEGQPPDKNGVTITDRSLVKSSEKASVSKSKPIPTQYGQARAVSQPSAEEPAGAAGAAPPGARGPAAMGSLKLDQANFRYPAYIAHLVQIISVNWFKPARTVETSPVVHFEIHKDGTITDARIVTSSGLPFIDRAALRAVIASSPLPPLPADYAGPQLGLQVVFE